MSFNIFIVDVKMTDDEISVTVTTDGSWNSTGAEVGATLHVYY